ncbi:MAG: exodeoxyribonuclease VII small subunit [Bacteroidales bacterium]|jgi:exodeoxyribonuclease VII small subunit|nr:exodeoxyribonuclease VII small subunit [Bacteroidales bacterium]MCK9447574.1 exodeoxyribonuclease VII small subunit [Bacteroidales bacterium]MDD3701509.1 exodeoxyribonuclease VII small subunit [Bacteroidales bacterium]MDY0369237.1 exodeoxyribonuclease VII small subunit [Bacteroidales bacterium]
MDDQISYSEAFAELGRIVEAMERGEVEIDELSEQVKRASLLIRICRDKLHATETDIQLIISDLENETK